MAQNVGKGREKDGVCSLKGGVIHELDPLVRGRREGTVMHALIMPLDMGLKKGRQQLY